MRNWECGIGNAEGGRKDECGIGNAECGNYRSATGLIRLLTPEFQNLCRLFSDPPQADQTIGFQSYLSFGYLNLEFICNLVLVICYFRFIQVRYQ